MSKWAAENLGHYPGRCRVCGWHIETQGHDGSMDHPDPDREWLIALLTPEEAAS